MMENYLNILREFGTNPDAYVLFGCIGFSFVIAAENIYSHLKAEKESKEFVSKLENRIFKNRLN